MDDIVSQVKTLAISADERQKSEMVNTLRNLATSLESPRESMERIAYSPLQLYAAKLGADLQLFQQLAASRATLSTEQLAEPSSANPALLGRILRYLSSMGMVDEPSADVFAPNNVTTALGCPSGLSYIKVFYEVASPSFYELPKFLAKTKYANPADAIRMPFQGAFNWKGDFFSFLEINPERAEMYDKHMRLQQNAPTDWSTLLGVLKAAKPPDPNEFFFVDVAGGTGRQCIELQWRWPEVPGRIMLEDLSHVIAIVSSIEGVSIIPYDVFTPQPIKNARFYYLRGVLHTFPDKACERILRSQVAGMGPESKLLIEELVLPDTQVHWTAICIDMLMMTSFSSGERTRSQWKRLLESSGLRIVEIHTYKPGPYESLIVAEKAPGF